MISVQLLSPILDGAVRSINFFNGRLLSGEDLTQEQQANKLEHARLAQSIGSGVAFGLEVSQLSSSLLNVTAGQALSPNGELLTLGIDVDISLAAPPSVTKPNAGFASCQPLPASIQTAGDGLYVLTIERIESWEGRAQVIGSGDAPCNSQFLTDGVQFRMVPMGLTPAKLADDDHLRNAVAYQCFGTQQLAPYEIVPFGPQLSSYGTIDALRPGSLNDDEVPLAVVCWKAAQIVWVDQWSARRRLIDPGVTQKWDRFAGDRRPAESEAMFLQFQQQLEQLVYKTGDVINIRADQYFNFLPAAGYLPTSTDESWKQFLGPMAPLSVTPVDEDLLRNIIQISFFVDPITVYRFEDAKDPTKEAPIPMDVYQVPERKDFVVFARSLQGRFRVFVGDDSTSHFPKDIFALTDKSNTVLKVNADWWNAFPIDDVPPGLYDVFAETLRLDQKQEAVGGRTTNVVFNPDDASIIVSLVDSLCCPIYNSGAKVTATPTEEFFLSGRAQYQGVMMASGDKWKISNLPSRLYDVEVSAPDYAPAEKSRVPVTLGKPTQIQVVLTPKDDPGERPPLTYQNEVLQIAGQSRLSVMTADIRYPQYQCKPGMQTQAMKRASCKPVPVQCCGVQTPATPPTTNDFIPFTTTQDTPYTTVPWENYTQINIPTGMTNWVNQWQNFMHASNPQLGFDKAIPEVRIDPSWTPVTDPANVPQQPPGYLVLGDFGIPLSITSANSDTKRPVLLQDSGLQGLDEGVLSALDNNGIRYVSQLAGANVQSIMNYTGKSADYARYLVSDAAAAGSGINQSRTFYTGMTDKVSGALAAQGISDEVGLANADLKALGDAIGSAGLASRLIEQAREIVPPGAWSIKTLDLAPDRVNRLQAGANIQSIGDLVRAASQPDAVEKLGSLAAPELTNKDAVQSVVTNLKQSGVAALTSGSLSMKPVVTIRDIPGLTPDVIQKLEASNVVTAADLVALPPAELEKNNIPPAVISTVNDTLLKRAGTIDIGQLASINKTAADALKKAGINTVADLHNASIDTVKTALGGDGTTAAAIVNSLKPSLGLRSIG